MSAQKGGRVDKQAEIIGNLIKEAEDMCHGRLIVEFKIHQGSISGAEVIEQRKKLG